MKPEAKKSSEFLLKLNKKTASKLLAIFSNLKELKTHYRLFCQVIAGSRKFFSSEEDGDTFLDITSKLDKNIKGFKEAYGKCFEVIDNQDGALVLLYFYCKWVKIRIETCRIKNTPKWEEKLNKSLQDLMAFTMPSQTLELTVKHEILWFLTKQWEKKTLQFPKAKNNQMIFDLTNALHIIATKGKEEEQKVMKSTNQAPLGSTNPSGSKANN